MKTAITELIDYVKMDVEIKLTTPKAGERFIWYIETYFIEKEKQQIKDAFKAGDTSFAMEADIELAAEYYYNETFKQ